MGKRTLLIIAAAVVLGGAAVGTWLVARTSPARPSAADFDVHTAAEAGEGNAIAQASDVVTALPAVVSSGRTDGLTPDAVRRAGDVTAIVPQGSVIAVERATWRRTGTVASMAATVTTPGRPPAEFVVVLLRLDARWLISQTYPRASRGPH